MAWFDLPLEQLRAYAPELTAPPDLRDFWDRTLAATRAYDLPVRFEPHDSPLRTVDVQDVTFGGFAGNPVRGWLLVPAQAIEPLPCIVEFLGYGTGRGAAYERLLHSAAGYAHLVMDTRGQGSMASPGDTPDPDPDPGAGQYPGFLTRGVLDPERYYYRRLIADAVRAVDAARAHPAIDAGRVVVRGHSQGGALALATGALVPDLAGVVAHAPFLCHVDRAVTLTDAQPYAELREFLRHRHDAAAQAFRTLSYVDGAVLAPWATTPLHMSVALMDTVCPPSTVFAAYNRYGGTDKEIAVWPYDGHESGAAHGLAGELAFLARVTA